MALVSVVWFGGFAFMQICEHDVVVFFSDAAWAWRPALRAQIRRRHRLGVRLLVVCLSTLSWSVLLTKNSFPARKK